MKQRTLLALGLGLSVCFGLGCSSSSSRRSNASTTTAAATSSTGSTTTSNSTTTATVSATRLAPTSGFAAVDTPIVIEGQNLDLVTQLAFVPDSGGTPLQLSGWTSTASMGSAVVPAGFNPGDYRLELTDNAGAVVRAALIYEVLAAPATPATLSAMTPDQGGSDQTHTVTLNGTGFVAGAPVTVTVGGMAASATVISPTEVEATVPAGLTPGAQPLEVSQFGQVAGSLPWTALNFSDPDQVGGYPVGYLNETIQGASGDRPDVRIYYPAQQAGANATPEATGGPYPVVVYNHGFKPPIISFGINYRNNTFIAERLASFGYVVACVDLATNNSLFRTGQANSERDADDTLATLDHFERINADTAHPLFGLLDPTRAALGGHSRGGDAALIAGATEYQNRGAASRVKALFAYGPPSTDSQNGNRALVFGDFTQLPLLLIGGTGDRIAPPAQQQDILALAGSPSMFAELNGGNHSQFKDNDTTIFGDRSATLALVDQHGACQRYTTAWLGTHVKGQASLFTDYVLRGAQVMSDARLSNVDVK